MNVLKLIIGVLVAAALVVLGAQNTQSVTFHVLAWDLPSVPVVLVLAIAVLLGVLLGWVVSIPGRFRGMRRRPDLQHQVEAHERTALLSHEPAEPRPEGEGQAS
jgi:uncharacterized integral membrane protein